MKSTIKQLINFIIMLFSFSKKKSNDNPKFQSNINVNYTRIEDNSQINSNNQQINGDVYNINFNQHVVHHEALNKKYKIKFKKNEILLIVFFVMLFLLGICLDLPALIMISANLLTLLVVYVIYRYYELTNTLSLNLLLILLIICNIIIIFFYPSGIFTNVFLKLMYYNRFHSKIIYLADNYVYIGKFITTTGFYVLQPLLIYMWIMSNNKKVKDKKEGIHNLKIALIILLIIFVVIVWIPYHFFE